jgi:hypothetical protein
VKRYIPLEECKDGYLYRISSRNLSLGVYSAAIKSFYGIRTKFGDRFIDDEYHWDLGSPFGTCKPRQELEQCPIKFVGELYPLSGNESYDKWRHEKILNSRELLNWLDTKLKEYQSVWSSTYDKEE